jgi:hypothetical protein
MADARDVDRSLRLARQVFSPSDEHRERVRSALASAAFAEKAAARGHGLPAPRRVAGTVRAALLVGVGFALGYWFAETRHDEISVPATERVADAREEARGAMPASEEASPSEAVTPRSSAPSVAPPLGQGDARTSTPSGVAATESARPVESRHGAIARRTNGSQRAHARSASSTGGADSFQEELALLARAERAIRAGNATLARSFIAELEARFPKTALRQERAALLVLAACATAEPAAQSDAREFLRDHAQSVYVDRIRSMCVLDPSAPPTSAPK